MYFPNMIDDRQVSIPEAGMTKPQLDIGGSGTGKTTDLANRMVEYFLKHPDYSMISYDPSGPFTDAFLSLWPSEHMNRIIYDEPGNPEWVLPKPEFSTLYGATDEENIQRVAANLRKLAPNLVTQTPVMGGLPLTELAPEIFRLCTAIRNEYDECWQVTEAKKLLSDDRLLADAIRSFGDRAPSAREYLRANYLNLSASEKANRRYAVTSMLGAIESREIRARAGYFKPAWTPREVIRDGLIALVSGQRLNNQPAAQDYVFTEEYSLIIQEINKRIPNDPNDKPVTLIMDEVYSLLGIEGMAKEVGKLPSLYRSRKLQLVIVLQALHQLAGDLRQQIWSFGNIVCFALEDFNDAYEIAQQLFKYDPNKIKMPARSETGQPIMEHDRGGYLEIANWIQRLKHRECIVRRYLSEKEMDMYIRHIPKTKDSPPTHPTHELQELKERKLRERGIPIRDALEVVNRRNINGGGAPPQVN